MKNNSVLSPRLIPSGFLVLLLLALPVITHAETYTYDPAGRLTGVVYDDGSSISYNYDANGNRLSQTVQQPDTSAPVITLLGNNPLTVAQGSTFSDPGSTVSDNRDTGLTATVTGTVDTSTVGTYTLTYTATDGAGNMGTATRTVKVTDQTAPQIVPPASIIRVAPNAGGINATDAAIVSFLGAVMATDNVDTMVTVSNDAPAVFPIGSTTVSFTAQDTATNSTTATATVTVNDPNGTGNDALAPSGTGLTIGQSMALGLDPDASTTDTDGDGVEDLVEVGDPASPIDSDGDGVPDVFEANNNDASSASGLPLGSSSSSVDISSTGETLSGVQFQAASGGPAGVVFPFGVISYTTTVSAPGASKTVRLSFTQTLPANLMIFKVDNTGNFTEIPSSQWTQVDANTLDLSLTDGGSFDLDGLADGVIVDPLAVGGGTSTSSGGSNKGGGGGGCSLGPANAAFDPTLPLLSLLALGWLLGRRSARTPGDTGR